jgi:hypothetical protein
MNTILISIAIGIAAGLIDIFPMILQKQERSALISAFLQYFFVAIVIVNIDLFGIIWWLQGGLISLALALPIIVIVAGKDRKAVPIIAGMAVILGTLIGIAGHYLM